MNTKIRCKDVKNLPSRCCEVTLGWWTHVLAVDYGVSTLLEDSSRDRTLACLTSKGSKFGYTSRCVCGL
jgi:hypothetical protein